MRDATVLSTVMLVTSSNQLPDVAFDYIHACM